MTRDHVPDCASLVCRLIGTASLLASLTIQGNSKQYLFKYKNLAHVHNQWDLESDIVEWKIQENNCNLVAEPPELFQLKCLSHAPGAVTHLNRNNPSVPQI